MSDKHRQSDQWDKQMQADCPVMYCGRLDTHTWNAETGERQMMVYFDGFDDRVVCEGKFADYVAYAANRYQPQQSRIAKLEAENAKQRELLKRWHHEADSGELDGVDLGLLTETYEVMGGE